MPAIQQESCYYVPDVFLCTSSDFVSGASATVKSLQSVVHGLKAALKAQVLSLSHTQGQVSTTLNATPSCTLPNIQGSVTLQMCNSSNKILNVMTWSDDAHHHNQLVTLCIIPKWGTVPNAIASTFEALVAADSRISTPCALWAAIPLAAPANLQGPPRESKYVVLTPSWLDYDVGPGPLGRLWHIFDAHAKDPDTVMLAYLLPPAVLVTRQMHLRRFSSLPSGLGHLPRELDHPTTLGIGGIGRDTVSGGVSQLRLG